jgi:hypothetical protein
MEPGLELTSVKLHVAIIVDYTNKMEWRSCVFFSGSGRLNIKDRIHLNLVTNRLNTLSDIPVSQVFYLYCKEFTFGDIDRFTLIPVVKG